MGKQLKIAVEVPSAGAISALVNAVSRVDTLGKAFGEGVQACLLVRDIDGEILYLDLEEITLGVSVGVHGEVEVLPEWIDCE